MTDRPRNQDPGKRMTKAQKREEGRRQREELERRAARRKRQRALVVGIAIGLAAIIVAVIALTGGSGISNAPKDLLARARDEAKSSSCTAVQQIQPFDAANVTGDVKAAEAAASQGDGSAIDRDHIGSQYDPGPPPLSAYRSVPPTSGPHNGNPMAAGVYTSPPDIYMAIHSLEHGATIVWYSPNAPSDLVGELTAFYDRSTTAAAVGQDRVIVSPYDYPSQGAQGSLPNGVQMALVSWHHLQTCGSVSLAVAFDFTSQYSAPPYDGRKYLGDAPEAGGAI